MSNQVEDFNLESFDDGTIRLSFTGPFSVLKKLLAVSSSVDQFGDALKRASKTREPIRDSSKVNPNAIVLHDPVKIDQLMDVTPLSSVELCDMVRIPVAAGDHYVFTDEDLEAISKATGVPFVICREGAFIPIGWGVFVPEEQK